jgi:hypothetical protein
MQPACVALGPTKPHNMLRRCAGCQPGTMLLEQVWQPVSIPKTTNHSITTYGQISELCWHKKQHMQVSPNADANTQGRME